ncbi:pentapeptide repeat-containing protein [Nocardia vulneris]|uniref:pentapeptide repeat-containing protein n=1 Tax=Nocardia vulneris TaxID=1141657 RepID=UPI0030CC1ACB
MTGSMSATGAQANTRSATLRRRLGRDGRAAIGRRAGRMRLFPAVTLALLAGLVVAFAAYGFLRWITPVDVSKQAAEIDVTRVALTVVAGVGGVVALVIAYRRQRDLEQSRFIERFGAAAAQLGATDVAVRIAGVYAMAGVADESDGLRRQQCIDVLCGYLRLPYQPELGANHQSKSVRKRRGRGGAGENEDHFEYRHNDREVRATIVRVMADRLRSPTENSWSASDFDFRTAHLEDVDLSKVTFSGAVRFGGAIFSGPAEFGGAIFSGPAVFNRATFSGIAVFDGARFSDIAGFDRATFANTAWFNETTFSDIARFDRATFSNTAAFNRATFSSTVAFNRAIFSDIVAFDRATFANTAWFNDAAFSGIAIFGGAIFSGPAVFGGAIFSGPVVFGDTTFSDTAAFDRATFSGPAVFVGGDFGSNTISFADPKQWGPPSPVFDWDQDVSKKPANVEPGDWPPAVSSPS